MIYKKFGDTVVLRVDPGENIIDCLIEVSEKESIKLGHFTGIGAVKEIEAGLFDPDEKLYIHKKYKGKYELGSLTGNITLFEGKPYIHAHGTWSDVDGKTYGGHISEAIVSVAGEIFITKIAGEAGRKMNDDIGFRQIIFNLPEKL